ncbi:MAG: hypothetical protein HFE51_02940 [Clostridia bacterium]|jgi:hypothetical protein|nr:hypothetical protein [Clostridia bacterium]MCI9085362.1 hypothetical protein [Clostridia bacterium]
MKKFNFKRVITMGIAAVIAVSAMSISAFAAETIYVGNDVTMTTYSENEFERPLPMTVDMTFSTTLTTTMQYLKSAETGSQILTLSDDETELVVAFSKSPSSTMYTTLYDVTDGKYLMNNVGPHSLDRIVSFTRLSKNHKYKIGFKTSIGSERVSGSITSN